MPKNIARLVALLFFPIFLAACSATSVTGSWKDENYTGGSVKKIMVIGIAKKPSVRRMFEDKFKKQLELHGTVGVSSYRLLPSDQLLEKEAIKAKAREAGVDSVIVTRLVDKKTETIYQDTGYYGRPYGPRPYYNDWHGYYSRSYRGAYSSAAYVTQYDVVTLETNLYELSKEKLIWSMMSETELLDDLNTSIQSIIATVTDKLTEDKLIGQN